MIVHCLRCDRLLQTGTPDPKARAIRVSSTVGFCPDCMITKFLLSIEPIADTINGTPRRDGLGPEIFLNEGWRERTLRPVMRSILAHTQLPEDSINWIEVVGNWRLPWPKGREPQIGANY